MFILDRCRRSSAAVAHVKYKCDLNNLKDSFARSKILLTEKLTNRALVTRTPGWHKAIISITADFLEIIHSKQPTIEFESKHKKISFFQNV